MVSLRKYQGFRIQRWHYWKLMVLWLYIYIIVVVTRYSGSWARLWPLPSKPSTYRLLLGAHPASQQFFASGYQPNRSFAEARDILLPPASPGESCGRRALFAAPPAGLIHQHLFAFEGDIRDIQKKTSRDSRNGVFSCIFHQETEKVLSSESMVQVARHASWNTPSLQH